MKLSIITPTHDTTFLKELEETILGQTYTDWEWVVLLNHGAKYETTDPRIVIMPSPFESDSVGMLKKLACMQATGDIIVEVDHDDLITPDCLEKIADAFKDPDTGFVFSDNAKLCDKFEPYDAQWGWTYRMFSWRGRDLYAMNSQPVYPGRMAYVWFAPDHVRAWRRNIYFAIGGHNDTLSICDDIDLMQRMYLVTKFHHIPEVLYIYRINGKNTWLQKNKEIQQSTVNLYQKRIYAIAERFAELNNLMKIDLCGGFNKPEGYISIDLYNGDIKANLERGIPLEDNSCGVVRAHDALEHIRNQQLLMSEIHRVLAPGGILLSQTPSTDGRGAWQDPTHVSFWNQNSFWYWTRQNQAKYINNTRMFRECMLKTVFPDQFCKENNIPYVIAHLEKLN
jgi:glycosyltransferase involved in cell wall biosynthesis